MAAAYSHLSTMGKPKDLLMLPYTPQAQHQGMEVQTLALLLCSTPDQQQGAQDEARVLASPAPPADFL